MAGSEAGGAAREGRKGGIPLWGKVLLAASILLMALGVALPFFTPGVEQTPTGPVLAPPGLTGFTGDGGPAPAAREAEGGPAAWSPTVFRMGFSFFVGFAIAFALRAFLKFALVAAGFFVLALFGLQYAGLVEVRWGDVERRYDEVRAGAQEKGRSAWDAMTLYLPSAASATAGLVAGFWRRR